jgi:virulence-associated protein VapD
LNSTFRLFEIRSILQYHIFSQDQKSDYAKETNIGDIAKVLALGVYRAAVRKLKSFASPPSELPS